MADRLAADRIRDFGEVDCGIRDDEAIEEAGRCLQCKKPFCVDGCPVGIDIPGFLTCIEDGDFRSAIRIIKEDNMLPAICGRVCPQEVQCEGECILGNKDRPVAIGQLERFLADWEREHGVETPVAAEERPQTVAVVGSGPAGLTAAAELARNGFRVTIFEALHAPGGVLTYGIPEFRLPNDVVQAEIDAVKELGVSIQTNHLVGRSISVDELMEYDAVVIATGAGLPAFMGIPGENQIGVYSANEFLTRVNLMHADAFPECDTPVRVGSDVVVVGGGNVAMDAARSARRLGANVTLVYRRRREDMPARLVEVHHAEEEGIEFLTCTNPTRIHGEGTVTGVEVVAMDMCELDDSGRPAAKPIPGSERVIPADVVIEAIGQSPNPLLIRMIEGLVREKKGNLLVDEDGSTTVPKIFAAGDVATGAATVILAMGAAKRAAESVRKLFDGE
ncbi:MAG: NADPH-dependent glutamate synthase [Methanocalculus sp. MSAO_Arc1]|uniref:NADPH-dependent glutamate synthase n=1 Tax=Methanocalculus TaxID=71151 RepID=UPI000FF43A36|nr:MULTISPECIES: NADPH-dependent glutamate synthase [unclassified Methanocalculus]MCP1661958.1 glutamate synthase (NADPH/NADH) small chain [Methanocalculus sp. AMF5]RQD80529.1 MAG: NADPH-dependent glutamate synthase [Methanocalculus sp. MSAO_Arc1]